MMSDEEKPVKKSRKRIYFVVALFMLFSVFPLIFYTESGLNILFQIISRSVPGQLEVSHLQGNASNRITFKNLRYKDETIDITLAKGELKWQPEKLLAGTLRVDQLTVDGMRIDVHQVEKTNQEIDPVLPKISLPFKLDLKMVSFTQVDYLTNNVEVLKVNTLDFSSQSRYGFIIVPNLVAELQDYSLQLNGKIKPQGAYPTDLQVSFKLNELFSKPFIVEAELSGDMQQLKTEAQVSGFLNGNIQGDLYDVVSDMHWYANADVKELALNSFSDTLSNNNIVGSFVSRGNIDNMEFIGKASSVYDNWGSIDANYDLVIADNKLIVNNFKVKEKEHPSIIQGLGEIDWAGEEVFYKLTTNWQQVLWPWRETAEYKSVAGDLSFQGSLSNFELVTSGDLSIRDFPSLQFNMSSQGNEEQLNVSLLEIRALEGKTTGEGNINWKQGISWQTELDFEQLNPGVLAGDWPGKIDAHLKVMGHVRDDKLSSQMLLSNLKGKLHDKPLFGSASVNLENGEFDIKQLSLTVADKTQLDIQGQINDKLNLKYDFKSDDLAALQPEAGGQLHAKGVLLGSHSKPQIKFDLAGQELKYNEYRISALESQVDVTLEDDRKSNIDLKVKNAQFEANRVDDIKFSITGKTDNHRISLALIQGKNRVNWQFSGALQDKTWHGQLVDSILHVEHLGKFEIEKTSKLFVEKDQFNLEGNCYRQEKTALCFAAQSQQHKLISNLNWKNLPISSFSTFFPEEIHAETQFNGSAEFISQKQNFTLSAKNTNTAGEVSLLVDDVEHRFPFQAGVTQLNWNSDKLNFNFHLPLEKNAKINVDASIFIKDSNLSLKQQSMISDLSLEIPSLIIFSPFVPSIKNLEQANMSARVKVNGSLSQPKINGFADINAPLLQIPELNVKLEKVQLHAESKNQSMLTFTGKGDSGEGSIGVVGEINQAADNTWSGQSSIQGNRFQVVDLPQATIEINPKLQVSFESQKVFIDGDIVVPYARLKPKTLPVSAAKESPDVLVVGEQVKAQAPESPWQVESKVRVTLGDRVNIDGFGLRSQLTGSLQLLDKSDSVTIGRGEINLVDGYYRAFGLELQISKGRFIFANTPVDDPGLDILAQRQIEDITAGIKVSSTLREPEIKLFSEPTMAETDALSYLLLGRPIRQINQSEGSGLMVAATAMGLAGSELLARSIGNRLGIDEIYIETDAESQASSLVIGRYLSPKLYVRYLTGIFERSNIIQLRYDVSKKVILQTETGTQMGADVFYTIED